MKTSVKKKITILILASCTIGFSALSFAAPVMGVKFSKHNLSKGAAAGGPIGNDWYSSTELEICVFCHTPHNAAPNRTMLWNRSNSVTKFALYTASPTVNFNKNIVEVGESSLKCLSCHDGATALNAGTNPPTNSNRGMINTPNGPPVMAADGTMLGQVWNPAIMGEWKLNIGEFDAGSVGSPVLPDANTTMKLTNDHPVSFVYQESSDNDSTIRPSSDGGKTVEGLPLRNGKVECVTCHDPHVNYWPLFGGDAKYAPFLRKPNDSSSLCFTCHMK